MPLITRARPVATKIVRNGRAKLQIPSTNALIRDDDATLGQLQLDIAKAQAEHVIEPHRLADEVRRKAVTMVRVGWLLRSTIQPPAIPEGQLT
jgi:hypothetical protein